jgi:hypothetical protein
MSNRIADAIRNANVGSLQVCPEFSGPVLDNLEFLETEFGFKQPVFKQVSRECWVTFNKKEVEIKIGYEPYTLPWGHISRSGEMIAIDDLMDQYGFHLDRPKYSEYDEIRKRLFALLGSPKEADEYALSKKELFDRFTTEWVTDLASFFRAHLKDILGIF